MSAQVRTFTDDAGVRGQTPMLFGLIGPSGSGKTFSALRLATGMQHVFGGDIFVVDTERDRAKHYADMFKFRHVPFGAPFSPDDYIAAIDHCEKRGAKTVIIDSMSHEHSGLGGVLEWHDAEVQRLMVAWRVNEDKANIPAWGKPKAARRKLINRLTQSSMNFILCFRAKDKIKIGTGKVVQLGWMPDAGEEFVFELTAKALLLPGAGGIPTWKSDQVGEQMMIKLPEQFRRIFSGAAGKPLDEGIGQELALWSSGQDLTIAAYESCPDESTLQRLEKRRGDVWGSLPKDMKAALKLASDMAAKRIAQAPNPLPIPNFSVTPTEYEQPKEPRSLTDWIAIFNAQNSLEQLEQQADACTESFDGEFPNECHSAYQIRKETLSDTEVNSSPS